VFPRRVVDTHATFHAKICAAMPDRFEMELSWRKNVVTWILTDLGSKQNQGRDLNRNRIEG
jgi:hypothetical protein